MLVLRLKTSKSLSLEFVADFYNPEAGEILDYFTRMKEESIAYLRHFLKNAQEKGDMNPNLNLDYVIWLMQKIMELCSSPDLMSFFPNTESFVTQISESMLYGIMPIKNNSNI